LGRHGNMKRVGGAAWTGAGFETRRKMGPRRGVRHLSIMPLGGKDKVQRFHEEGIGRMLRS